MQSNSKRKDVLDFLITSPASQTPRSIEKYMHTRHCLDKKQTRALIRELVEAGEIVYTYEHGRTLLEVSYQRPVRISQRLVLKPPRVSYRRRPGEVVVQIQAGASFGAGRHPTTRLALRAIDALFAPGAAVKKTFGGRVLDIGTGTGVLVVAAVCLGAERGLGLDIDACARAEAAANVAANGLDDRITISGQAVEALEQQFSLIMANLRYPSLIRLAPVLERLSTGPAALVLSGIQAPEQRDVLDAYAGQGFAPAWRQTEQGWTAVVLQKQSA
jgi:ribosomal protein L11 methyltransferase